MKQDLHINFKRLQADIEALGIIGRREDHGIYRMAFSDADKTGREWFKQRVAEAGLEFYQDGAANLFARLGWDGRRPTVMIGSHLDTVPGGGVLDGALGVLVGLECLRTVKESGLTLQFPLEAVAFSDEEGRFGGLFGSQAIVGDLTPDKIYNSRDLEGLTLIEAMAAWGLDATAALGAQRNPESIHAFLELHIEQGPILDSKGIKIGVVEAITGLFKWEIRLIGTANHAGTTPMNMRQDAFLGLAEFANEIPRIIEEHGSENSRATIGRAELSPGAANTVPGQVLFSLDVRDTDQGILQELANACRRALSAIARRRRLMFEFDILSEISPVRCDPGIAQLVSQAAQQLGLSSLRMASGAAHDTQNMASITRAGMIFVPSIGGRSHSAAEWTPWESIEMGANAALNVLYQLAK